MEELAEKKEKPKLWGVSSLGKKLGRILPAVVLGGILVVGVFSYYLLPPLDFPTGKMITIKNGELLSQVAVLFENEHFVRSRTALKLCTVFAGSDKGIIAGEYLFKEPVNVCTVGARITRGIFGIPVIKVTVPEGSSNKGIEDIMAKSLPRFNSKFFEERARLDEGYLFPETYFFPLGATAEDVEIKMRAQFEKKIEILKPAIAVSGHSLREIIIMASLLEKEAKTDKDRAFVSGILWKRIKIGMPLQVDAPFYYLLRKTSNELTQTDLSIKSGYNTYKNKGLPIGPIGNPGLEAISDAIYPKDSPYLYYLSDKGGVVHYAKNFEEHKTNKIKYLK